MKKSIELQSIDRLFYTMGRAEMKHLMAMSNLNRNEIEILSEYYFEGKSKLDIAEEVFREYSAFNKMFRKTCRKFVDWLNYSGKMPNICK